MPNLYSFVQNVPLPDPPSASHLACIPIAILPVAIGALESRAQSFVFRDVDAYYGIQLIRRLQVALILGCESMDRLYRLLDSTVNGVAYMTTEVDGLVVITPDIPVVPAPVSRSIHSRLERIEYMFDNAYNGAVHAPDFLNATGVRQQLADLITAVQAGGQLDDDMLASLVQIAGLLA